MILRKPDEAMASSASVVATAMKLKPQTHKFATQVLFYFFQNPSFLYQYIYKRNSEDFNRRLKFAVSQSSLIGC